MKNDTRFVQDALEALRFDGEPDSGVLNATQEKLMKLHGKEIRSSTLARRLWIGSTFVLALGVGAVAGPRVLEWWEHLTVTVDEELPDGSHHVVAEDDQGQPVFDDTLQQDEALIQLPAENEGGEGTLLKVAPAPEEKEQPH